MMNKESLKKNIERMEADLADMKQQLNRPDVRTMYDEAQTRDFHLRNCGACHAIGDPSHYAGALSRGALFHTKELADEHDDWLIARAYLVKRISEINEGVVPMDKWRSYWMSDDHTLETSVYMRHINGEKYLRLSRELTDNERAELLPYYKTYFGVEDE